MVYPKVQQYSTITSRTWMECWYKITITKFEFMLPGTLHSNFLDLLASEQFFSSDFHPKMGAYSYRSVLYTSAHFPQVHTLCVCFTVLLYTTINTYRQSPHQAFFSSSNFHPPKRYIYTGLYKGLYFIQVRILQMRTLCVFLWHIQWPTPIVTVSPLNSLFFRSPSPNEVYAHLYFI